MFTSSAQHFNINVQHSSARNRKHFARVTASGSGSSFAGTLTHFCLYFHYDFAWCINYVAGGMCSDLSEWMNIFLLRLQSFFFLYSSRCTYSDIKSWSIYCTQWVHTSHRENYTMLYFPLFIRSNAPYVQHTSGWPSPWSSDSLSDERSIAFLFCCRFLFSEKNKDFTQPFHACVCVCCSLHSVRCTIVSNGRLASVRKQIRCICYAIDVEEWASEWKSSTQKLIRETARENAKNNFRLFLLSSLFLMRFDSRFSSPRHLFASITKRLYWKWNLFDFRIFSFNARLVSCDYSKLF